MFTSKELGRFPRDPEPYVFIVKSIYVDQPSFGVRMSMQKARNGVIGEHLPRPEFNTPVNPILAALRANVGAGSDLAGQVRVFLNTSKLDWSVMLGANDAQMEHARKVLTRLVALGGGTNENA